MLVYLLIKMTFLTIYFSDAVTIVRFLRGCKFDTEKARKKIKCFYELRGSSPEWFENRNPLLPELQELLKLG